jgi:hypothetical protein
MWDQIERKCKLCGKVYRVDGNQNSIQDSMCPACEKFLKPLTECFVPVIRCKNCANGMVSDNNEYIICCRLGVPMGFDDYCSCGERKVAGELKHAAQCVAEGYVTWADIRQMLKEYGVETALE